MSRKPGKGLSSEDRILWHKVAKSVKPLAGKAVVDIQTEDDDFAILLQASVPARPKKTSTAPVAVPAITVNLPPRLPASGIDRPTRNRIARGRLPIEGKVDLHGLTQSEAHSLLLSFLRRAYQDGRRHVLVVTGKGSSFGSEGVLRRAVPGWLATPPFRLLVSAHEPAATRHGGEGALYVRLRRLREPS